MFTRVHPGKRCTRDEMRPLSVDLGPNALKLCMCYNIQVRLLMQSINRQKAGPNNNNNNNIISIIIIIIIIIYQ